MKAVYQCFQGSFCPQCQGFVYKNKYESIYEKYKEIVNNNMIPIFEVNKDTYKEDSSSTFSSVFDDDCDVDPELNPKQVTNATLDTIINIFKDDDYSFANVGQKYHHDIPDTSIPDESLKSDNEHSTVIKSRLRPLFTLNDHKCKIPKMDWENYHRLDVIHTFLDDLEYDYPSICTTAVIGKSVEGRDLKILKISNSDATNSSVWIDAGIHAREWIAPAVATYIANHIARNFSELPASVTNKDWYFLPVVNPDGYEYSHTVDRMWRKSRAWYGGTCVGVDLNRNFSCGWGGHGSSSSPSNVFYRGPEPFSEPESSAIRDMLIDAGISFKVYITLHSFGQVIIFPFAHKEDLCPDYIRLLEGATVMSKAINECRGNIYKVGISKDVMYGAAGTSYDFSYGVAGVPFSYLIELRKRNQEYKLPQEEIDESGNEILNCVIALMNFVDETNPKVVDETDQTDDVESLYRLDSLEDYDRN